MICHFLSLLRRACGLPAEWTALIRQTNRQEFAADSYDKITDLRHKCQRSCVYLKCWCIFVGVFTWVFSFLLQQHVKKKLRVKVMEYWIETARECFNIGNFNSLMAIIAGLNMSPISRLKKTVSEVTDSWLWFFQVPCIPNRILVYTEWGKFMYSVSCGWAVGDEG